MAFAANNPFSSSGALKPQGSIFGAPQQQQPSTSTGQTSLFGNQQQQQPASGLFGQQQPTGNSFGQSSQQQQQQQPANSIFGQPQQQQQQQLSAGSLFGQSAQQQQQPTSGLFAQSAAQQQQPSTSGLFSQPAQQQQTGSLFGQPNQQQQQQPQQQPSLFGGSLFGGNTAQSTTTNQQQQPSLFGSLNPNTQQQPQQQNTGLFGNSLTTNSLQAQPTVPAGGFGGGAFGVGTSIFGKPQTQTLGFSSANQSQSGPLLTRTTKFNDLPDEFKRVLESIDSHIQGRVQISKDLHQRKLGDEPTKGHELIRETHKELVNTSTTIRNDLHFTKDIKVKVEQAVQDTIVATRIVDGFRNPQGGPGFYLKDHAGFPLEFFTRVTEQMKERLAWYKSTIEQIERKLSSSASQAQTPQGISATLQAQHATFLSLAGKTAALDADLQKIKTLYTQLWRSKTGSVRDPFNELDRMLESGGDYGMGDLNVK